MRYTLFVLLAVLTSELVAQNKNTTFYDSVNQVTTWEGHWAQVVTGRYKSIYHKKENTKRLIRTTQDEFDTELRKTEKRITRKDKVGTDCPDFDVEDLNGKRLTKAELKGKVLVLNFWFIGCAPCEMERPSLNDLTKRYANNDDVVFISFAKDDKERLAKFLPENPILYQVVAAEKELLKTTFAINEYPVNIVVDRNGKYSFNSSASGIGILTILQRQIDKALEGEVGQSSQP